MCVFEVILNPKTGESKVIDPTGEELTEQDRDKLSKALAAEIVRNLMKKGEEPMNANKDNPAVGRDFESVAARVLRGHYNMEFGIDVAIPIGEPAKNHKFDCVSVDEKIVAECKCYSWTETGNIPSAKMGFVNEAVFYLSYLPADVVKIVVMKKAVHVKRNETLAKYYTRINKHLLKGIKVIEIDTITEEMTVVKD